jgi:hypothetical protein
MQTMEWLGQVKDSAQRIENVGGKENTLGNVWLLVCTTTMWGDGAYLEAYGRNIDCEPNPWKFCRNPSFGENLPTACGPLLLKE